MEKKHIKIEAVVVSEPHVSRAVVGVWGRFLTLLMMPARAVVLLPEGQIRPSSRSLQNYW